MSKDRHVKPIFFIHTIDPINWPILFLFVRPFFKIVCFQYNGLNPHGFERLKIASLSSEEFEQANQSGLQFAKEQNLEGKLCTFITIGEATLDLSNYFAKDYLRYVTDLCLAAQMIAKLPNGKGIFVLPRICDNAAVFLYTQNWFQKISGLTRHHFWDRLLQVWYTPWCGLLKWMMTLSGFMAIVVKKIQHTRCCGRLSVDIGDHRLIYINYIPSELESDCLRKLSAGFFVDGKTIQKEDVLFLSRECPQAQQWRKEGYCVHSIFDFIDTQLFLQALLELVKMLFNQTRTLFHFLILMSPKQFINVLFCELFVASRTFRGVMYTNSDAAIEPMISASFRARKLPVVLFYYSASTFVHPMWSYLQATDIFVWNEEMISFLNAHPQSGQARYYVAGPLMQVEDHFSETQLEQLQREAGIVKDPGDVHVGIFDIAAIKESFLEDSRFVQNPKLTSAIHKDFVLDICRLGDDYPQVKFMIKPKRWTHKHDIDPLVKSYIDDHGRQITLLPPTLNPQVAIQSCDVVICFPFTSIFFAAIQKGIPAVFYYPFEDPGLKKIQVFQPFTRYGKEPLRSWFFSFMKEHRHGANQDVHALCGIAPGDRVRQQFIHQLKDLFYAEPRSTN